MSQCTLHVCCQISTSGGRLARLVRLRVVQPVADIRGSGVYHVERGSAMSLTCAVRQVGIWVTGRYTGQRGVPRGAGLGDEPHLRRQTGGYLGHWPIYGAAGCTTWSGAR